MREDCPFCTNKKITLKELKKLYVEHILFLSDYNKTKASKILSVSVRLIRNWIAIGLIKNNKKLKADGFTSLTPAQRDRYMNRNRY